MPAHPSLSGADEHAAARAGRELLWFFACTLGATAALHGSIALLGLRFSLSVESPVLPLYLLGLAMPTVVAVWLSGAEGRRRFLARVLRPGGPAVVYGCALVAQSLMLAVAWVVAGGGSEPAQIRFAVAGAFGLLALGQLWVVLGEEPGWRGFALARLEQLTSPRSATLVLAFAWGVWHAPMFFVSGSFQAREPIWLFGAAIFAWSCVHTALHQRARPSVVPNLVFHACANLTLNLVEVPTQAKGALAGVYMLVGLAVWLGLGTFRPSPSAPNRTPPRPAAQPN